MTDEEKSIVKELFHATQKNNDMTQAVIHKLIVVCIAVTSLLVVAICVLAISFNLTIRDCTKSYFETDYDYGTYDATLTNTLELGGESK